MSVPQTPTAMLRKEHQLILAVLNVLQRVLERGGGEEGWDFEALDDCIRFFRLFADACHHGKEEDLLFPELEARGMPREGGPIGVMLMEHQQGRAYVSQMAKALAGARSGDSESLARLSNAARGYLSLLRNHIMKEDNVLFNMADGLIDTQACRRLCGDYDVVCRRRFEGHTLAELEGLAAELQGRYGRA